MHPACGQGVVKVHRFRRFTQMKEGMDKPNRAGMREDDKMRQF